jgi:hypothetical protein
MEAALAAAALSFLFLSPPSSSATFGASYAGCGSSRRSESLFAAPAARSDHQEGASRFRGAGACSAQWSPTSSRRVMSRTSLWCSAGLGLWPAHKPSSRQYTNTRLASATTTRGARWLLVVCGMRAAGMRGCGMLYEYEVVRLFLPKFRCGATVAAFS